MTETDWPSKVVDLLEEMIKDDGNPNSEYCWWCGRDVNGKTPHMEAEPHEDACCYVRARQLIEELKIGSPTHG